MTEWLPLVADRPFIMGQMGSFVPPFSPDWTPHGQIHPLPSSFPFFHEKPIGGDSGALGWEWMKYLQIILAVALCHYWQKPNKQGYRGKACKYLVFRSRQKVKRFRFRRAFDKSGSFGEILALPIYLFRVNCFNRLVCLSKLMETT